MPARPPGARATPGAVGHPCHRSCGKKHRSCEMSFSHPCGPLSPGGASLGEDSGPRVSRIEKLGTPSRHPTPARAPGHGRRCGAASPAPLDPRPAPRRGERPRNALLPDPPHGPVGDLTPLTHLTAALPSPRRAGGPCASPPSPSSRLGTRGAEHERCGGVG